MVWTLLALTLTIPGVFPSLELSDQKPYKLKTPRLIHNSGVHLFFLNQDPLQFYTDETKPTPRQTAAVHNGSPPLHLYHNLMTYLDHSINNLGQYEKIVEREHNKLEARAKNQNSLFDDLPPIENTDEQLKQLRRVKRYSGLDKDVNEILSDPTVHGNTPKEPDFKPETELYYSPQDDGFVSTVEEMISLIDKELKHKTNSILKRFTRENSDFQQPINNKNNTGSRENISNIPVVENVTINIPLMGNFINNNTLVEYITKNIPLVEKPTNNIPLNKNNTSNIPVVEHITSSVPLSENITKNIALQEILKSNITLLDIVASNVSLKINVTTKASLSERLTELETNPIELSTIVSQKEMVATLTPQKNVATTVTVKLNESEVEPLVFDLTLNKSDKKVFVRSKNQSGSNLNENKAIVSDKNTKSMESAKSKASELLKVLYPESPLASRLWIPITPSKVKSETNIILETDQRLPIKANVQKTANKMNHTRTTATGFDTNQKTSSQTSVVPKSKSLVENVRIVTLNAHQTVPEYKPHLISEYKISGLWPDQNDRNTDSDDWPENGQESRQDYYETENLGTEHKEIPSDDQSSIVNSVYKRPNYFEVYHTEPTQTPDKKESSSSFLVNPILYLVLSALIAWGLITLHRHVMRLCPRPTPWPNPFQQAIPMHNL